MTDVNKTVWTPAPNADGGTYREMDDAEFASYTADKEARHTEYLMEEVLDKVQNLLSSSDWTQLGDTGLTDACKASFATYRASLRAIRRNPTVDPTWPTKPTEEWT